MTPDDARHGTTTGYRRGCREACCRKAMAESVALRRKRLYLARTDTLAVPNVGVRRRIQALVALGWSQARISEEAGYNRSHVGLILTRNGPLRAGTAERIAEVYERLSMTLPPETTTAEKCDATRSRNIARRNGWLPPLAWNNIDDENEHPDGWAYTPANRAEMVRDLVDLGYGINDACARLNVSREGLEKWCARHGMSDLYAVLVARESTRYWVNQHGEGGAA